MTDKKIQISERLFLDIFRYFAVDTWTEEEAKELESRILHGLNAKVDAMARREEYTTYKTARTEEEREAARLRYLDAIGMRDGFRWRGKNDI